METVAVRLLPGQDLKKGLQRIVEDEQIDAGFIITCVGNLREAVIRLAGAKEIRKFSDIFEIISVEGTLAKDKIHVHIGLSDKNGKTIGGHLKEGCIIHTTAEIIIGKISKYTFSRELDKNTGFTELKIKKLNS